MPRGHATGADPRLYCVDCPPGSKRPARRPGPRCATHQRERRAAARDTAFARYLERTYRLSVALYWEIYEAQGGTCYGCQRATGKTKRLAVDHDHRCCPTTPTCGTCTRGLLCGQCNRDVLGHLRDDPAALRRLADYIENPPARRVLLSTEEISA